MKKKGTSGMVLQMGYGTSHIVPIFEGQPIDLRILRLEVGGMQMTDYLRNILNENGHSFTTTEADKVIVRDIKEKLGYVALDFAQEMARADTANDFAQNYELPDGQVISVGSERIRCAELLFKPSLSGLEASGIHHLAYQSVMQCDVDIRAMLYENVVLSGGSSMFNGMAERMTRELGNLSPPSIAVNVTAPERKYNAWIGGAMIASLSSFDEMVITKSEFVEEGPSIVQRKCLGNL